MSMVDVIVVSGGKCGSSTLKTSLLHQGYRTIKCHNMNDFNKHYKLGANMFYDMLDKRSQKNEKHLIIIDSYRKPIERKISSFFENLPHHVPDYEKKGIEELISIFNTKYLLHLEEYPNFMDEIMNHYNIDLFKSFNEKKKYNIKSFNNITYLRLHFDEIDIWGEILSKVLNIKLEMIKTNISSSKHYKDIYNEFKEKYKVPRKYLRETLIKDNNFLKNNSKDKRDMYIKKWMNRSY